MDQIAIVGGAHLEGEIAISGAKNSAIKLMAASLLTDEPLRLTNMPRLADTRFLGKLLRRLGAEVTESDGPDGPETLLHTPEIVSAFAPYDLVRQMRASFNVLGPLLARTGHAKVSLPGGCAIGARPVDLHLKALEALGAHIDLNEGYVYAQAPRGLSGARIVFPISSVGATEHAMLAAVLARGETVLVNAAQEPEIVDLADCLNAMGARIENAGTSVIRIVGVPRLSGATHRVTPDRIETGTYAMAAAMAGGEVRLTRTRADFIESLLLKMEEAGVQVERRNDGLTIRRNGSRLRAVDVETGVHPGFATDFQAQFMALMTLADGESVVRETIFENRFMHVPELARLGADITVSGGEARIRGVEALQGAPVMATDLRASVSLVIAALAGRGETVVNRVYHLDRGFERLEQKLSACGARVRRLHGAGTGKAEPMPLRLLAEDADDLAVISAALQDAVARIGDIQWEPASRRFTIALNRFRWEAADGAGERVRSGLQLGGVLSLKARNLRQDAPDAVVQLLAVTFQAAEPPGGVVILHFADGADLAAEVECIDAVMADLSEPWSTPSTPEHPEDDG